MTPQAPRPRRAPEPDERRRDAERTRRALLDAALVEFAEKGRAGARVSEIAARAGVNKQLISYYFGGKDGLHAAIVERWHALEDSWSGETLPLEELVTRYLQAGVEEPDLQRLFLRELLDAEASATRPSGGAEVPPDLADFERRQAAGEIAPDVDPALALLMFQSAICAGVIFANDIRTLTGLEPTSAEYLERYGALLRRVVRGLAGPAPER